MSLVSVEKDNFFSVFRKSPHVFLDRAHLDIHLQEGDKCLFLVDSNFGLGVFLKISEGYAQSPYAAPFGGLITKDDRVDWTRINQFVQDLASYLLSIKIQTLRLVLPAPIYAANTTTKLINSLINSDLKIKLIPEINSHLCLLTHDNMSYPKNIREIIRKTSRENLKLVEVHDEGEKLTAYKIVEENRLSKSRKMSISYDQLRKLDKVCYSRYFIIRSSKGEAVASAITFKSASDVVYAQFWGDSLIGRSLNAMDFLAVSLVDMFQAEGWQIFDLGISTESGNPNAGLLRFKESHLFTSTLKFTVEVSFV